MVHKIKLNTKYQRPRPASFRQEDFKNFAYRSLCRKIGPFRLKGQGQPKVILFSNFIRPMSPMLHNKHRATGPLVPEKNIFKGFTIYRHDSDFGRVTLMRRVNFLYPYPSRIHMKFGSNWLSGF